MTVPSRYQSQSSQDMALMRSPCSPPPPSVGSILNPSSASNNGHRTPSSQHQEVKDHIEVSLPLPFHFQDEDDEKLAIVTDDDNSLGTKSNSKHSRQSSRSSISTAATSSSRSTSVVRSRIIITWDRTRLVKVRAVEIRVAMVIMPAEAIIMYPLRARRGWM